MSCQELAEESRLLSKTLACNVSSPIFKAGRQVSVGQPFHKGLSWQTGRRSWLWGREQVVDQEGSVLSQEYTELLCISEPGFGMRQT